VMLGTMPVNAPVPVLPRVIDSAALVAPVLVLGSVSGLGLRETTGAVPVPVNDTL